MEIIMFILVSLGIYGLYWLLLKPKSTEVQEKINKWL